MWDIIQKGNFMKIGILTFHDADNYGAILQAYALQETIKKINSDVEIINYKQPNIVKSYRLIKVYTNSIYNLIRSILSSLIHLYNNCKRKSKFRSFRKKYMNISREIYYQSSKIKGKDIYITGSDQVWNGEITNYDRTYFLNFCLISNLLIFSILLLQV